MCLKEIRDKGDDIKLHIITPKGRNFRMHVESNYLDFYLQNAYENYTQDLLLNFLKDNMLFIDIGAHYGYYTLLLGTRYPYCKIISFEPTLENFQILAMNAKLNDLKNVEIFNLDISDTSELNNSNVTECSSHYDYYVSENAGLTAKTITLDDLLKKDISKIPIIMRICEEGHEMLILDRMKDILEKSEDIKLFLKFNPEVLKRVNIKPEDLLKKIKKFGFDIYAIDDELRRTYKLVDNNYDNWSKYFNYENSKKNNFNILCMKKEKSLSMCFFFPSPLLGVQQKVFWNW